jgi:DNA gyrase subunit A
VVKKIAYLEDLLSNPRRILLLVKEEMAEVKEKYGDSRRTQISDEELVEFREEDLIPRQRMAVTLSNRGFIKRVPYHTYKPQHRGGRGIIGMVTREADAVRLLVGADTHDILLFFTNRGKVFSLKCHKIPLDTSRTGKGMAVVNFFPVVEGEQVTAILAVPDFKPDTYLLLVTSRGEIKKTSLDKFTSIRLSGLLAMDLEPGDELVAARLGTDQDEVILVTQKGQSIKFAVSSLRATSRTSGGVRAIRLGSGDRVVSTDIADPDAFMLVITSGGFGKLTKITSYPKQHRAGGGVRTFKIADKTGDVAASRVVSESEQLMIISADGIVISTPVREKDPRQGIPVHGRSTQGVKLMRLSAGDKVVAIACFDDNIV